MNNQDQQLSFQGVPVIARLLSSRFRGYQQLPLAGPGFKTDYVRDFCPAEILPVVFGDTPVADEDNTKRVKVKPGEIQRFFYLRLQFFSVYLYLSLPVQQVQVVFFCFLPHKLKQSLLPAGDGPHPVHSDRQT